VLLIGHGSILMMLSGSKERLENDQGTFMPSKEPLYSDQGTFMPSKEPLYIDQGTFMPSKEPLYSDQGTVGVPLTRLALDGPSARANMAAGARYSE